MSEINVTAGRYVPDKPKTIASEQLEVYVPVAGYNNTGTASYDPNSFIVDDGNVKLRRNPVRVVTEISQIDATTGKATITYDDNSTSEIVFPVIFDKKYDTNSMLTIISFTKDSFIKDDKSDEWLLIIPSQVISYPYYNSNFVVSLEEVSTATYQSSNVDINLSTSYKHNGFITLSDAVFKGEDGSLLITVQNEAHRFDGRVLIFGGIIRNETIKTTTNIYDGNAAYSLEQADSKGNRALANNATAFGHHTTVQPNAETGEDGYAGHSEGGETLVEGRYGHAEGEMTKALARGTHSEGKLTQALGMYCHVEGSENIAGFVDTTEGKTWGDQAIHAEGMLNKAMGRYSHAEGKNNIVGDVSYDSQEPGQSDIIDVLGDCAHGEGQNNKTYAHISHVQGSNNTINEPAVASHVEGNSNTSNGPYSHTEGSGNTNNSNTGHVEGQGNSLSGTLGHLGGYSNTGAGRAVFAHGQFLDVIKDLQTAFGQYNDPTYIDNNQSAIFQIGNGTSNTNRRNAFQVLLDGRAVVQTAPKSANDVARKTELDAKLDKDTSKRSVVYAVGANGQTSMIAFADLATTGGSIVRRSSDGRIGVAAGKSDTDAVNYKQLMDAVATLQSISFEIVQQLPTSGEQNIIYLLPKSSSSANNVYDEYIWINNSWELIGTTAIDLSDYYTKTQADNKFVAKQTGYTLSQNDYTDADKAKLDGVSTGAQVNVIESVKVNNVALSVANKSVNIPLVSATANGAMSTDMYDVAMFNYVDDALLS